MERLGNGVVAANECTHGMVKNTQRKQAWHGQGILEIWPLANSTNPVGRGGQVRYIAAAPRFSMRAIAMDGAPHVPCNIIRINLAPAF